MLCRAGLKSFPSTLCFNKIEIDCRQHVPVGALAAALDGESRWGGLSRLGLLTFPFVCSLTTALCGRSGPPAHRPCHQQGSRGTVTGSFDQLREGGRFTVGSAEPFHQDADHLVVGAFISRGLVMTVENGGQNRIHLGELHAEPLALNMCREPGGRQRGAGRQQGDSSLPERGQCFHGE